jgi:hypothetical protein
MPPGPACWYGYRASTCRVYSLQHLSRCVCGGFGVSLAGGGGRGGVGSAFQVSADGSTGPTIGAVLVTSAVTFGDTTIAPPKRQRGGAYARGCTACPLRRPCGANPGVVVGEGYDPLASWWGRRLCAFDPQLPRPPTDAGSGSRAQSVCVLTTLLAGR